MKIEISEEFTEMFGDESEEYIKNYPFPIQLFLNESDEKE